MPEIKDPTRLAAAMKERGATDEYQERAFTGGWRQFERGLDLLIPVELGPEARDLYSLGYEDAEIPYPAPAVAPPLVDAREQRRFELAKAALQGFCAAEGAKVFLDAKIVAANCWDLADAMLAARDAKDGTECA